MKNPSFLIKYSQENRASENRILEKRPSENILPENRTVEKPVSGKTARTRKNGPDKGINSAKSAARRTDARKRTATPSLLRTAALLVGLLCLLAAAPACAGKKGNDLPAVETWGAPLSDAKKSTVVTGGFTVEVHSTYAEITGYSESGSEISLPATVAGVPVRILGESVFKNNPTVTRVTLPEELRIIDRYAFEGTTALEEVVFNEGLETVGDYAFRNSSIKSLNLPDSLVKIGSYCFYKTKISTLNLPENLRRADKYAFYGCENLTAVTFPATLTEISDQMFYSCTALTEIVLPKTVTKVGAYAFSSCTALKAVVIPKETTSFGEGAFTDCPALTLYAPAGSEAEKNASRNHYPFEACDYEERAGALGGAT